MLAGNKRVAVQRIPSHEIMYSSTAMARGKNCGKVQVMLLTVSPPPYLTAAASANPSPFSLVAPGSEET